MELLASLLEVLSISSMAKAATQLLRSRSNGSSRRRQWSHADERSGLSGGFSSQIEIGILGANVRSPQQYCFGKDVWVSPTLPDFLLLLLNELVGLTLPTIQDFTTELRPKTGVFLYLKASRLRLVVLTQCDGACASLAVHQLGKSILLCGRQLDAPHRPPHAQRRETHRPKPYRGPRRTHCGSYP